MAHPLKHFATITKHRHKVIKYCAKAGILLQGLRHDLSKYSPSEFVNGARYYVGTKSPNTAERKIKGYSQAWLHHKGRNKHHFEYWTDYNPVYHKVMPVKMPLRFVIEMFCDRVAAGAVYKGEDYTQAYPLEYFENGREHRFIHPETSALLEKLLVMLAEKGEDETFSYIKNNLRKQKDY
ncbi:MAG: DUF5662 family protein [Acutalibacteraceae bacterium]